MRYLSNHQQFCENNLSYLKINPETSGFPMCGLTIGTISRPLDYLVSIISSFAKANNSHILTNKHKIRQVLILNLMYQEVKTPDVRA